MTAENIYNLTVKMFGPEPEPEFESAAELGRQGQAARPPLPSTEMYGSALAHAWLFNQGES